MWTALISKELRECGLYAGVALLIMAYLIAPLMDAPLLPFSQGRGAGIPFISDYNSRIEFNFAVISIAAAIVLGLHQSIWESWRQTSLFLLHRPVKRTQLFVGKLSVGIGLILGISAVPLLIYSLWAAMPGTHASPFYWGMTETWWVSVLYAIVSYLGAFLTGLRPARWLGSRTWPAIAAISVGLFVKVLPLPTLVVSFGLLIISIGLVASIIQVAKSREYP